ncbi:MAG TPA: glycosyltransferase [Vicinamibacterales bacterium]|jgi:biofilm PGA synthesis N-glycosyltransferase PgaC|nr:glycosyltransferase [Vicinamibacterales bacterium]
MTTVFWISTALVLYVYAGYPTLVAAWARLVDRQPRRAPFAPGHWPSISVIVAARNESRRLPARVVNLLSQDYPGQREIIVVSDGSLDNPARALAPFAPEVRLIELPSGGKPAALNAGVAAACGEVLIFVDARQRFASGTLQALVENLSDPSVGGVTGELILDAEQQPGPDSPVGEGLGLYWRYEKWIRRNESRVWSTLGATGAIYALRRSLWRPLPAVTLLDDVLAPMRAVLGGYRVVFDDRARAFDRASTDAATETRRKKRTLAGNYQILAQEPRLLLPVVNPVWLQYLSHKVGRLIVPWALMALLLSSLTLIGSGAVYVAALGAQLVFYALAAAGAALEARQRMSRVAFTFVLLNFSAIAGLMALRRGREVWR